MTLRQEMVNMLAVRASKGNRIRDIQDCELFIYEFAQDHKRLTNFRDRLSTQKHKAFVKEVYKAACNW